MGEIRLPWPGREGVRLGTRFSGHALGLSLPLLRSPRSTMPFGQEPPLGPNRVPAWTGHTLGTGRHRWGLARAAFKLRISVDGTVGPDKVLPLKFRRQEINR